MFTYWGRRGALSQFAVEVARAALADPAPRPDHIGVAPEREFRRLRGDGARRYFPSTLFRPVPARSRRLGAFHPLRRRLHEKVRQDKIGAVIELMPHVWSPLVMPAVRPPALRTAPSFTMPTRIRAITSWAKPLLDRSMRSADLVVTLSAAVASRIMAAGGASPTKFARCFIRTWGMGKRERQPPTLAAVAAALSRPHHALQRVAAVHRHRRVAARGRDRRRDRGIRRRPTRRESGAAAAHGAEVVNRWLTEAEIAAVLAAL